MVGPVSDTGELLRGVAAPARKSYYRTSSSRYVLFTVLTVLFLATAILGLAYGGILGIVLAMAGTLGLALVSIWLCMR